MMRKVLRILVLLYTGLQFSSCGDVDILSPPGPVGLTAYKEWVKAVASGEVAWTSATDPANFFKFLKGEKGEPGAQALDIWQAYIKTGMVDNPHKPGSKWDPNKSTAADFYYFLTGAKGEAGMVPHINQIGNWQIGDKDTGIPAKGKDGESGQPGQPGVPGLPGKAADEVIIGLNGNWEISGVDTGISATGKSGLTGADGKSALELWIAEVREGNIKDSQGTVWPSTRISLGDFWDYLSGGLAIAIENTLLKLVRSDVDPQDDQYEVFEFLTDPGAVVTMQFAHELVSATADETGKCVLRFKNKQEIDIPVLITALKTGKKESVSLLSVVKIRQPYFRFSETVIWLDEDDNEMALPNGEFRPNDEIPYLHLKSKYDEEYKAVVTMEFANVKEVVFRSVTEQNFNDKFEWKNTELTKATLTFKTNSYDPWLKPEGTLFLFQIIGLNDVVNYKYFRVVVWP